MRCSCGYHSYRSPVDLITSDYWASPDWVAAGVENWGKVIEHETGWRSEYQKPIWTIPLGRLLCQPRYKVVNRLWTEWDRHD